MEKVENIPIRLIEDFLRRPFTRTTDHMLYDYTRLSHDLDLTAHYTVKHGGRTIPVPRALFFHPYHPTGEAIENEAAFAGYPGSIITVRLPKVMIQHLPLEVLLALASNKIDFNKIDVFFVTQNMPWKNQSLLFRAHYWVHGQTENDESMRAVTFNRDTPCHIGIFSPTHSTISCDGLQNKITDVPCPVTSHPGFDAKNQVPMVICSPPTGGVMQGIDFNRTDSFFSVAIRADGQGAAVTLNWLLNPDDQESLTRCSNDVRNLESFIEAVAILPKSRLTMEDGPLSQLVKLLGVEKLVHVESKDLKQPTEEMFAALARGEDDTALAMIRGVKHLNLEGNHAPQEMTLVDYAAFYCCPKTLKYLISQGANITRQRDGKTILQYAQGHNKPEIVQIVQAALALKSGGLLFSQPFKKNNITKPTEEMFAALARGEDGTALALIQSIPNLDLEGNHAPQEMTLVDYAAFCNCLKTLEYLLAEGVDITTPRHNGTSAKCTTLQYAGANSGKGEAANRVQRALALRTMKLSS